jgi:hypothetical protein
MKRVCQQAVNTDRCCLPNGLGLTRQPHFDNLVGTPSPRTTAAAISRHTARPSSRAETRVGLAGFKPLLGSEVLGVVAAHA